MKTELEKLIELARKYKMTPEELRDQRRSFVYGNTNIENPRITREMVEKIDIALNKES